MMRPARCESVALGNGSRVSLPWYVESVPASELIMRPRSRRFSGPAVVSYSEIWTRLVRLTSNSSHSGSSLARRSGEADPKISFYRDQTLYMASAMYSSSERKDQSILIHHSMKLRNTAAVCDMSPGSSKSKNCRSFSNLRDLFKCETHPLTV
jgi:hypothetical protein